jgi:DNA helicase-2/ATP-dependent DNA helicase PcrA
MTSFIDKNAAGENAYELARVILADSGLIAAVHSDNTPENISRQENLDELINGVNDFISARMEEGSENLAMTDFLGEISLATDQDTDSADGSCVTLMTVHAAKGLEFKNVIIVGVEEDLFPAAMSADSISGIEEERRLLYVAITRAKDNCVLTYATSRFHNGQTKSCTPSRFIMDIDPQYLSLAQTSASAGDSYKRPSYPQPSVAQSFFAEHTRQFNNEPKPKQNSAPIRPAAPSVPSRPSQQSADDFGLHASTELSVGMKIEHSRFGVGEISKIDRSGASAKIVVSFGGVGEKTLLLKFARFKILS